MEHVAGKVAFITGGASGIGLGMAGAFVAAGMRVVIADIRREALDRALASLAHAAGAVHPIQLDVMDRAQYARAADEAERVFGAVHVLCNNAGIGIVGSLKQATYDDWDWGLGCILGGTINGVQTFLPRMLAHGQGGHIINTVSLSGLLATPGVGIYATAKHAVMGLTEALRQDLDADGIGVSGFIAGATRTELAHSHKLRPAGMTSGYPAPAVADAPQPLSTPWMEPAEAGEIVLRGLRRNDLYIWPANHFADGIRDRAEAIVRGMPDNPPDLEIRKRAPFNQLALYRAQTQVPPWPPRDGEVP